MGGPPGGPVLPMDPNLGPPPMLPPTELDLTPTVPYYELPAGLMAPLVKVSWDSPHLIDWRGIKSYLSKVSQNFHTFIEL